MPQFLFLGGPLDGEERDSSNCFVKLEMDDGTPDNYIYLLTAIPIKVPLPFPGGATQTQCVWAYCLKDMESQDIIDKYQTWAEAQEGKKQFTQDEFGAAADLLEGMGYAAPAEILRKVSVGEEFTLVDKVEYQKYLQSKNPLNNYPEVEPLHLDSYPLLIPSGLTLGV